MYVMRHVSYIELNMHWLVVYLFFITCVARYSDTRIIHWKPLQAMLLICASRFFDANKGHDVDERCLQMMLVLEMLLAHCQLSSTDSCDR